MKTIAFKWYHRLSFKAFQFVRVVINFKEFNYDINSFIIFLFFKTKVLIGHKNQQSENSFYPLTEKIFFGNQ